MASMFAAASTKVSAKASSTSAKSLLATPRLPAQRACWTQRIAGPSSYPSTQRQMGVARAASSEVSEYWLECIGMGLALSLTVQL